MDALLARIADLKAELDALRPLVPEAIAQLRAHFDVELTYTSNAIEGNTLTLRETAEVIAHGVTVGGKPLRDHLEALDHHEALRWMREIATGDQPIDEATVCELHRRIVLRSQPEIAGLYSRHPRRVAGSPAIFPNPLKIPELMRELGLSLQQSGPMPSDAFNAHFRLTAIHPFSDGNGRTARLLMNLLLIRQGYPPLPIGLAERGRYLDALAHASAQDDLAPFQRLMHERLEETLAAYLSLLGEALPAR